MHPLQVVLAHLTLRCEPPLATAGAVVVLQVEAVIDAAQPRCRAFDPRARHACFHAVAAQPLERHVLEQDFTIVLGLQVGRAVEFHYSAVLVHPPL